MSFCNESSKNGIYFLNRFFHSSIFNSSKIIKFMAFAAK